MRNRPCGPVDEEDDDLADWLHQGYAAAYRTAYGLLRNRTDAEDAVQEAFLRAWRFRAAVPSGDAVQPWLYRVVVNACLSKLRRDGRYRATVMALPDGRAPAGCSSPAPATDAGPEERVLEQADQDVVLDALADLPEHLRVVVVLRYYGSLSEKEIATVIHRRPGTVKSRLHEARRQLGADARLMGLNRGESDGPFAHDQRPGGPAATGSERR